MNSLWDIIIANKSLTLQIQSRDDESLDILGLFISQSMDRDNSFGHEVGLAICASGRMPSTEEGLVSEQLLVEVDSDHEGAADASLAYAGDAHVVRGAWRGRGCFHLGLAGTESFVGVAELVFDVDDVLDRSVSIKRRRRRCLLGGFISGKGGTYS